MGRCDEAQRLVASSVSATDSSSHRIAWNALVRSGGEVIAKLASVAFYVVMARELGDHGFGDFMFALSLTSLLLLAAGFGIDDLTIREVARDRLKANEYLSSSIGIKVSTSIVLLLAAAIVVNVAGYSHDARLAVYLVGAGTAVELLSWSWHAIFAGYERLDLTSVSIIVQRLATAVVGSALLLSGYGVVTASAVFLGGAVLGFVVGHAQLRRLIGSTRVRLERSRWLPLMKAGFPLGLVTLLLVLLIKVDTVLLSFLSGGDNSEVGLYNAAYRLVEATMFITWSIAHAALPWLARQDDGRSEALARGCELGLKGVTAVLMPIGVLFCILAEPLIELFYGPGYEGAITSLRFLAITSVLYGLNYFSAMVLVSRRRPTAFIRTALVVIVQNIAFNLVLIPRYGADGAAFNAALSGLLLAGASIYQVRRTAGRLSLARVLAGPLLAGGAAAGVVLAAQLPLVASSAIGLGTYAAVLLTFERAAFRDDAELARSLLRRRPAGDVPPVTPRPVDAGP